MKKAILLLMIATMPMMINSQELSLILQSNDFKASSPIPLQHAHLHGNISPHFAWSNIPANTVSFAFICHDPDAPSGNFIHWILFNIPASMHELPQGISTQQLRKFGVQAGENDFGRAQYDGPQPPSGKHRYIFTLYALDSSLPLKDMAAYQDVMKALSSHIIASCSLIGTFSA
jgi:hypothetical protein